jgi:uncharacterized protein (DUF1501 family)
MLDLVTGGSSRDCAGVSRRDFLRIGTLGLGGLSLPRLLAARDGGFVRDRSVVLLFLSGGASHIETFDPKMDAPAGVRSMTGSVATSLPGVRFGGTFPRLAALAHRMAVVRTFQHPVADHEKAIVHVLTGGTDPAGSGKEGHSLSSIYSRLRGANHPEKGTPTSTLLTDEEVDPQYRNERERVRKGSLPGSFGAAFAPFDPGAKSQALSDMTLRVPPERLNGRRELLDALDGLRRDVDASGTLDAVDKYEQQAVDVLLRGAGAAFDVAKEDPKLLRRYDTSRIRIGKKEFRPSTLGRQMLLARRLCESGCGFVTVHSAGWDMHADGNNPGIVSGMEMLGTTLDIAVSAFLEDVQARGLSEKILLVVTGDFGRTPKVNRNGGRDHWSRLGTLAFSGGGLQMGQVVGDSDPGAAEPAGDPVTPADLRATILHSLFDLGELRVRRGLPRGLQTILEEGRPIPGLV